jgi:putative MATE family efflux protein
MMKDMTQGPVGRHILGMASFIALSTMFQTLYLLVDLYFVGRLGKEAIAGVAMAGSLTFLVLALTQALAVGTTALIANALGRKDRDRAELLFNQSLVLSVLVGVAFFAVAFATRGFYCRRLAADAATAALGERYLGWYVPALFLQFVLVAMGAALRGLGDVKIPTLIQVGTIIVNIVLAPVLIFGWGTGRAFGVAGAAMASFIAIVLGLIAMILYFEHEKSHLRFRVEQWPPRLPLWGAILKIGLPAGGEFALLTGYLLIVYAIIRPFGAAAQAGFGIGGRVMQSMFLPAVAVAFATAPVAGQNFGARLGSRVRGAFYFSAIMTGIVMLLLTLLCHVAPEAMIRFFNNDPDVVAFGADYLRIISWNFIASGVVFVSGSVFQAMGNTLPPLACSATRLVVFAVPAVMMSRGAHFQMRHLWYLSVATVAFQMVVNMALLQREFRRKLNFEELPEISGAAVRT